MGSMAKGASEAKILKTTLAVGAAGLEMRVGLQLSLEDCLIEV